MKDIRETIDDPKFRINKPDYDEIDKVQYSHVKCIYRRRFKYIYTKDKLSTPLKCTFLAEMYMHQITLPKPLSRRRKFFDTVPKKTLSERDFFFLPT